MKTAVELRAAFAARELSPVEIVDAAAEHAELGAFVTLTLERAREEAERAERAYADGTARPLEGLTLAVKDLFDTEGVETTYGSQIFKGHVPKADAYAVKRARDAGAIVVGKTLTHEFAWGITSNNPHFPPCRNPWDPERVPGGSSGGSAVAVGLLGELRLLAGALERQRHERAELGVLGGGVDDLDGGHLTCGERRSQLDRSLHARKSSSSALTRSGASSCIQCPAPSMRS